jgi:TRAP-type uncharacterized transport system fused permease subunit
MVNIPNKRRDIYYSFSFVVSLSIWRAFLERLTIGQKLIGGWCGALGTKASTSASVSIIIK